MWQVWTELLNNYIMGGFVNQWVKYEIEQKVPCLNFSIAHFTWPLEKLSSSVYAELIEIF